MAKEFWVEAKVPLEVLAEQLASEVSKSEDLIEFVLRMDTYRADVDFTVNLIDALQAALDEESD